jgi:hypothetical protein
MRTSVFALVLMVGICAPAHAETPAESAVAIVAQQKEIRSQIEAREGRYEDMPGVKRASILKNQDILFALLESKSSIDELNVEQKTEAFNALQSINAAINNKEDERLVCEKRTPAGSNRVERVCRSVAQIKADREAARTNVQSNQGICTSDFCNTMP